MIKTIAMIACGGALGAVLRHGVNMGLVNTLGEGFPWWTLTVNIVGSFLMGVLIIVFDHLWQPTEELRLFMITGFLGALTTFSTFSFDVFNLWERHAYGLMAAYMSASVVLSIAALFAGVAFVRQIIA